MSDLTDYDIRVLRCIAGEDVPGLKWGAAMSVALEALQHSGLVTPSPGQICITDKGRELLAARKETNHED